MDTRKPTAGLSQACHGFAIEGTYKDCVPYGNGHINDTYLLTYQQNGQEHAHQRAYDGDEQGVAVSGGHQLIAEYLLVCFQMKPV